MSNYSDSEYTDCGNSSCDPFSYNYPDREFKIPIPIYIYAALAIVGVLGNASIILVIVLNAELRRSQINVLIIQLAIGDLLFILLTGPIKIEHEIDPFWESGAAACKAYRFGETLAMGICVYSITAFSIRRFMGVVMRKGERNYTNVLVCAEWVTSIAIAVPTLFIAKMEPSLRGDRFVCRFSYSDVPAKIYVAFWVSFLYAIPLIIIAYTNVSVIVKLLQSTRKFSGEQVNRSLLKQFKIRRNRAAMFILITVFFAVFWLPYYVYRFLHIFYAGSGDNPLLDISRNVHYYAAIANSCCNPYVMYMMSSKYRQALCCRLSARKTGITSANSVRSVRVRTTQFSSLKTKQQD
ncbi:neuropeptide CCHamide-1 receptor-like [Asterias rubens]|uniref:neuropeptide CCHamide-1 receptor-like n=1 Tax=Asterias rubens TaxID=7604 RepID=UPI001455D02B|nr:neuropeptide CCHamide-1 receptor-like [Asterias rubens]